MAKVSDLPNELLRNLFLMISPKDRKMAALVSRRSGSGVSSTSGTDTILKNCITGESRRIHHIQEIQVEGYPWDEWKTKHLEILFKATLELPKLKKVDLWEKDLRSVNSELLARALAKLEELSLVGIGKWKSHELTTNNQRLAIINEIAKYECLKKLSLVKFNLGTLELEAELLAKVISGLHELNMHSVSFTNGQVQEIFKSISENNNLTKVEFNWLNLSSVEPELLGIALTGIESVSLQQTKFSPHQLRSLFTMLGQNTKIKTFHSVENDFSAVEPRLFAKGLSKLEEVMFCVNNLTDDQVQALFIELKENCKLKSLDIDSDDLSSVDADDLAAAVDNIEELGLVYTQLSTEQITAILTRSQQNTNLKELDLGDNCMCGVDPALVTAVKEMLGNGLKIDQSNIKSEIELPGAPVTATLSEAEVSVESSPVCSPVIPTVADFKRPFHGWSRETEPRCGMPWVEQDYSRYDMHTLFTLNPILTISIGGGKKAKSTGENVTR